MPPRDSPDREISADLPGKEARKKRENGVEKKENRKKEGGKLKKKNWKEEKLENEGRTVFFSLFCALSQNYQYLLEK